MIKVAVIDDDIQISKLIAERINKVEFAVCSGIYEGPLTYIETNPTDQIVLLDVLMPQLNGIDAIPKLLDMNPELIIIINTIKNNSDVIFKAIKAGAMGYLDKQSTPVHYDEVFTSVLNGGAYLTPSVALQVINHFKNDIKTINKLTNRENDVAVRIRDGKSYNKVADELNISVNTVRMHIKNIYTKLQISSKYELMSIKKM